MATPAPVSGYKDRSTWLVVFGILQGLLGLAILGMIPLLLLSLTIAPKAQAGSARADLIQISMIYLSMAAIAFVLAGGSIWPRRWARALTVAYCWIWLAVGLITIPLTAFLLPRMMRQMPNSPPPGAEGVQMFAIGFAVFFATMLFVVTPGTFLLFYSSGNVKATVEARDPHPRWTDRCPTPVLVLGVFNALGAVSLIAAAFGRLAAFPFFGLTVSGLAARAAYLVLVPVWAIVAWGVLTMRKEGWWGTLGLVLFFWISNLITFARVDLMEFYRRGGMSEQEIEIMSRSGFLEPLFRVVLPVLAVIYLGYILFLKRYFDRAEAIAAKQAGG